MTIYNKLTEFYNINFINKKMIYLFIIKDFNYYK